MAKQLISNHEERKTFNYAKGAISFSVTIRVDSKGEIMDMLDVLDKARVEIQKELESHFPIKKGTKK